MSAIKEYFLQAGLAQAAYGTFSGNTIEAEELTRIGADMSSSQAAAFVEKWEVVAQSPYSSTGLSATVFEEINSGKKYLAIRGTEPTGSDLTADGLLAAGLPSNLNPQFIALKALLEEHWLVDGTLDGPFTVTGHSLGGYLAAAVKQSYSQVTEAYLYNAPGVGGLLGNLADAIGSVLGLNTLSSDNIWNLRSSEGFPAIAGLGYQLGSPVSIQTEKSLNNHGISVLADSLTVHGAYAQAAPNLTQSQLNSLIDAFGTSTENASNEKTLEAALDALRFIVSGPTASKTETGNRDALYENLNNTAFKAKLSEWANTTQFTLLADKSAGDILNLAKSADAQGLAVRYALVAGNPFALTGADYSAFTEGGALERFDPTAGTGKITDDYLNARIQFLERAFWFNTQDQNPYNPSANTDIHDFKISTYLRENIYFEDAASGYKIQQGGLFANTPRYYFGDDKASSPPGSASKDYLFGGAGDDNLTGGESDDYLEGSTGNDSYSLGAGDGIDTIWDVDSQGVIRFGTVEVKGKTGIDDKDWVKLGNSWMDKKNGIEYVLEDKGNGVNDLLVYANDGRDVRIQSWSDGKLGITLAGNAAPENLAFAHTFVGDLAPSDPPEFDEFGNLLTGPGTAPDRKAMLHGSSGSDVAINIFNDVLSIFMPNSFN